MTHRCIHPEIEALDPPNSSMRAANRRISASGVSRLVAFHRQPSDNKDNGLAYLFHKGLPGMAFMKVAAVSEVAPGAAKKVTLNGRTLALFNVNGTYYAIDDSCTHRGAPLSEGDCEDNEVICPWHGARFNLATGEHLTPPAPRGVTSYQVQIVGDEVHVDLP